MSSINLNLTIKKIANFKSFLNKYSDLISSLTILVNDILFLLGETVLSFPKPLGNFSFVVLNIAGFLSLNCELLAAKASELLDCI